MKGYMGTGTQVSAGVYAGAAAAVSAWAGAVQVHPEGGEDVRTLEVMATSAGTAQALRLLRWYHANYVAAAPKTDLVPLFTVPYVKDGNVGRMMAGSYEFQWVTGTVARLRLLLNYPEGVDFSHVQAALGAGHAPLLYFQGNAWGRSGAQTNVYRLNSDRSNATSYYFELDGVLFWGSGSGASAFNLFAFQNELGLIRLSGFSTGFYVRFNGRDVIYASFNSQAYSGIVDNWGWSGAQPVDVGMTGIADVGRIAVCVWGSFTGQENMHKPSGPYNLTRAFMYNFRAAGLDATHAPIPLEVA